MWRDTARTTRLGPLDGRAVFPLAFAVIHPHLWKIELAAVFVALFGFLEFRGLSVPVLKRMILAYLSGPIILADDPVRARARFISTKQEGSFHEI